MAVLGGTISQESLRKSRNMRSVEKACEISVHIQGSHRLEKYLNIEGFLEKF